MRVAIIIYKAYKPSYVFPDSIHSHTWNCKLSCRYYVCGVIRRSFFSYPECGFIFSSRDCFSKWKSACEKDSPTDSHIHGYVRWDFGILELTLKKVLAVSWQWYFVILRNMQQALLSECKISTLIFGRSTCTFLGSDACSIPAAGFHVCDVISMPNRVIKSWYVSGLMYIRRCYRSDYDAKRGAICFMCVQNLTYWPHQAQLTVMTR